MKRLVLAPLLVSVLTVAACGDDPVEPDDPVRADLVVASIGVPSVSCPGGAGTCIHVVEVLVENLGDGAAPAFSFRTSFDPAQSVEVTVGVSGGLPAGLSQRFDVTTPQGDNCYDPDCTVSVLVDSENDVVESDETNNTASKTTAG